MHRYINFQKGRNLNEAHCVFLLLRVKLILACQEFWPPMNRNRLLFFQMQTLPLIMHHKLKELFTLYTKQPLRKFHWVKGKLYYLMIEVMIEREFENHVS